MFGSFLLSETCFQMLIGDIEKEVDPTKEEQVRKSEEQSLQSTSFERGSRHLHNLRKFIVEYGDLQVKHL